LNDRFLTILFGTNGRQIIIDLDKIENIKCETKDIKGIFRIGGKIGNVLNCIKEIKYILINLNAPLERQYNTNGLNRSMTSVEDLKIEITENGMGIILYKPPKGGFRPFLDEMSKIVKVSNADIFDYENKYPNWGEVFFYLVTSACYICLLYVFSKSL
jgi:hypothetical protein